MLVPLVDAALTERLLAVAVAGADPGEVMPRVDGPPGWTDAARDAFRAFYEERWPGLDGPLRTVAYVVVDGETIIGMIRLTRKDDERMETGIWLARPARGKGHGGAALRAVADEARRAGARTLVADTTPGNRAALAVLRRGGAALVPDGDIVYARLELDA